MALAGPEPAATEPAATEPAATVLAGPVLAGPAPAATVLAGRVLAGRALAALVPAALAPAALVPAALAPAELAPSGYREPEPGKEPYRCCGPAKPGRRRPPPASGRSRGTSRHFACRRDRRRSGRPCVPAAAEPCCRAGTSARKNAAA